MARKTETSNLPAKTSARKTTEVAAPSDWKEEMRQAAAKAAKVAAAFSGGGNFLSFKQGTLSYKGLPMRDNKLDAVVLASTLENVFYDGVFDPDKPQPPVCFAFGDDVQTMVPHEKAPDPQSESCAVCPHNQFGSAAVGKGKACKNQIRLGLIAYGDGSVEQLSKCELAFARPPVTSSKNWAKYAETIAAMELPPWAVVTAISAESSAKYQTVVHFETSDEQLDLNNKSVRELLRKRSAEAEKAVAPEDPYPAREEEEAPAKPQRGAAGKKPAPRTKY